MSESGWCVRFCFNFIHFLLFANCLLAFFLYASCSPDEKIPFNLLKASEFFKQFHLKTGVKETGAVKAPSQNELEYLSHSEGAPTMGQEAFGKLDMIMKLGSLCPCHFFLAVRPSSFTSTYFHHRGQSCCKHPTSFSDVARS